MKRILILFAVLVLSIVFYGQDKAYANKLLAYEEDDDIEYFELDGKYSVVQPIEIDTYVKLVRSTVNSTTVFLIDIEGNIIPARIVLQDDSRTVMVVPTKPLKYATDYGVFFTSDVQMLSGGNIKDTLFVFVTEAKPKDAKQDVTKVKKPTLSNSDVEYLISAAFTPNYDGIIKWNKGLQVALIGKPTAADKKEVNKILKEISTLTGLSAKVTSAKNANIKMYFGTQAYGAKYIKKMPANTGGYTLITPTQKSYVNKVDIFVNSTVGATAKKHTIRKMLTMSLGMPNNTYSASNSILYKNSKSTSYSSLDKKIIKALYSPHTPVGTTKAQLREMYRK